MGNYKKHIEYCRHKKLKPVSKQAITRRKGLWRSEAKIITTPHLWCWGTRISQWETIMDMCNDWCEENNVKVAYQVYRYNYYKNTLPRLLNKLWAKC